MIINNEQIINVLKATIDHNAQQSKEQVKGANDEKEALLIQSGFEEVINGHFDLLKMFVFIDLIESNNLNLNHLNDLINEHLEILSKDKENANNQAVIDKVEYNIRLWETIQQKMDAYINLLNPVE